MAISQHWWFTHKKIIDKYIKEARSLMESDDQNDAVSAIQLLNAVLSISPRLEIALELKARALLFLRRFKDVANMLQDYIPSLKLASNDEDGSVSSDSSSSSGQLSKKLLSPRRDYEEEEKEESSSSSFKCFSVSELKKKVMAGICKNCDKQGQWRYVVLGQACCHLGLMEDAMVLLQTGKRLATAEFRRQSISRSDDSFTLLLSDSTSSSSSPPRKISECETITHLLATTKLLLRRRAAAFAALNAGHYSDSIRHFTKIIETRRRPAPQGFLADCYLNRATAYRSAGRIAEAIADCNKTLALNPSCIQALETRASLLETVRCFPDSLHDLEHLKLLYNTILRDRKLPGPPWKPHNDVKYREIPGRLCVLTTRSQKLKSKIANGEIGNVDYHGLIGVRRGCTRSELDRANLLLCLRHKPDKALSFIERCDFSDQNEIDSAKDRAKMSSLLLYRLIQRGYSVLTATMIKEEEEQRKKKTTMVVLTQKSTKLIEEEKPVEIKITKPGNSSGYQGVFCRDLAAVGNLLSRTGFNQPIPVKYQALSC